MNELKPHLNKFFDIIIANIGSFLLAIAILIVGWWLIKKLNKALHNVLMRQDVSDSLRPFLEKLANLLMKVLLLFVVADMVGVEMTSFIAALGAAGLAVGLSLQGSLANFAGGVVILLFKPFEVGDFIKAKDQEGIVREIDIFYTYLQTSNKRNIVIPNGELANTAILNASKVGMREVDAAGLSMKFKVGYHENLDVIKQALIDVVTSDEDYVADPGHDIYVLELEEDYVIFNVQAWVKTDSYYKFLHALPAKVKKHFDKIGLEVPYSSTTSVEMVG